MIQAQPVLIMNVKRQWRQCWAPGYIREAGHSVIVMVIVLRCEFIYSHPQTKERYLTMLTRFERISTIQGCSIIFQGLARRFGCFSKLGCC